MRAVHRIGERSPGRAVRWANGLQAQLRTLEGFPNRCPVAPEFPDAANPVRELIYGKRPHDVYRIFYQAVDDLVRVVSIRNALENVEGPEA